MEASRKISVAEGEGRDLAKYYDLDWATSATAQRGAQIGPVPLSFTHCLADAC
jgi:hypothetical protein